VAAVTVVAAIDVATADAASQRRGGCGGHGDREVQFRGGCDMRLAFLAHAMEAVGDWGWCMATEDAS